MKILYIVFLERLFLPKAIKRDVFTQKCIHHKPGAEAEAGDEGVQFGFAHELGVGVAEAEKQLLVFAGELLGELFLQVVQRVRRLLHGGSWGSSCDPAGRYCRSTAPQ